MANAKRVDDGYEATWQDERGHEQRAEGETLEALAADLAVQGYDGPTIRVLDVVGFTAGWVSASEWRAA